MSNTVAIKFRSYLPAQGFDGNGLPSSRKQMVVGEISVTSLSNGESLSPADVGLETIDRIEMTLKEPIGGASGAEPRDAHYSFSAQEFYVLQDNDAANTTGNNYTVHFTAWGESALAPQLV